VTAPFPYCRNGLLARIISQQLEVPCKWGWEWAVSAPTVCVYGFAEHMAASIAKGLVLWHALDRTSVLNAIEAMVEGIETGEPLDLVWTDQAQVLAKVVAAGTPLLDPEIEAVDGEIEITTEPETPALRSFDDLMPETQAVQIVAETSFELHPVLADPLPETNIPQLAAAPTPRDHPFVSSVFTLTSTASEVAEQDTSKSPVLLPASGVDQPTTLRLLLPEETPVHASFSSPSEGRSRRLRSYTPYSRILPVEHSTPVDYLAGDDPPST
jgi:hypothetical protein